MLGTAAKHGIQHRLMSSLCGVLAPAIGYDSDPVVRSELASLNGVDIIRFWDERQPPGATILQPSSCHVFGDEAIKQS